MISEKAEEGKQRLAGAAAFTENCAGIHVGRVLAKYGRPPSGVQTHSLRVDDRLTIRLVATSQRLGSVRWWLMCPGCSARSVRLYRTAASSVYRCRTCHGLHYRSRSANVARGAS